MGYLQKTGITQTVLLSQGYKAEVKALRGADEDAVQAALLGTNRPRATVNTGDAQSTVLDLTMDNAALQQETLLRGIDSWTLDDEQGAIVAIDAEHIAWLTGGDRALLFKAINDLTEPPGDVEKKGSPSGSTPS